MNNVAQMCNTLQWSTFKNYSGLVAKTLLHSYIERGLIATKIDACLIKNVQVYRNALGT